MDTPLQTSTKCSRARRVQSVREPLRRQRAPNETRSHRDEALFSALLPACTSGCDVLRLVIRATAREERSRDPRKTSGASTCGLHTASR